MAIRNIFFDLDDTLVIEGGTADAAFLATCERAHEKHGIDPEALHQAVRYRARELWRESATITYCRAIGISSWEGLWALFLGNHPNLKTLRAWAPTYRREAWYRALADHGVNDSVFAEQLSAIFWLERRSRHVVFSDVEDNLRSLRENYRLVLVTNGTPDLQREKIQGANLARFFDAILISGEVGVGKPDCRIFELALEELAASPSETVMIGDSLSRDILGAQHAGLKGIWLNRSSNDVDDQIIPDAQMTSLNQIYELLPILASEEEHEI